MAGDFDLTWHSGDNSFLHVKAGWTRANGDTVNEYFLETAAPGSFSYDLRGRAPQVSFTSPDPTSPAGLLLDFARLPTVQSDRSEARRVGKECVSTCSSRWSPLHVKKTITLNNINQL